MDTLGLFIIAAVIFIAINLYFITKIITYYTNGILLNSTFKKAMFVPVVMHYIAFCVFSVVGIYAVVMSFLLWSTHPLLKEWPLFWQLWWYWGFISPAVVLLYLKIDDLKVLFIGQKEIKHSKIKSLISFIFVTITIIVVLSVTSVIGYLFSQLLHRLFFS
ncbi:hypothetical protein [Zophobihabitans entericus]|uniref:Uncharacterized protein n=1 Tax=Zophobihabitans entericus TaxID=1635327 RepID=A0A6G9IAY5_9GAMM|nr:hypothetical protein [Zophobihabitans entericus]QIQ21395.1 hypothetical protein IPMB12_06645 [Zophobihabitans entericus]